MIEFKNDNILRLRGELSMTQEQFARYCNISRSTLARYECGTNAPNQSAAQKIANACHVSVDYVLGRTDKTSSADDIMASQPAEFRDVSTIEGNDRKTDVESNSNHLPNASVPSNVAGDFIFEIKLDTMEPTLCKGDTVVVSRNIDVKNGDIALVFNKGELHINRIFWIPKGVVLISDNTKYPSQTISFANDTDFAVKGTVMTLFRSLKSEK